MQVLCKSHLFSRVLKQNFAQVLILASNQVTWIGISLFGEKNSISTTKYIDTQILHIWILIYSIDTLYVCIIWICVFWKSIFTNFSYNNYYKKRNILIINQQASCKYKEKTTKAAPPIIIKYTTTYYYY